MYSTHKSMLIHGAVYRKLLRKYINAYGCNLPAYFIKLQHRIDHANFTYYQRRYTAFIRATNDWEGYFNITLGHVTAKGAGNPILKRYIDPYIKGGYYGAINF